MSESPVTAPVCYRHPSKETYIRCTRCERPICPDCMNEASVGHQCPECVAQGRRTQRTARTAFGGSLAGRAGIATKSLIGVNVLVMVISILSSGSANAVAGGGLGGLLGGSTPLTDWGSVVSYTTVGEMGISGNGEWWRLFTAMFLHYGVIHLLLNMYALWILGRDIEGTLGPLRFTGLYLLAGFGGNVAAYLFTGPNTPTAGASTAVFGLMAAMLVLLKRLNLSIAPILPVIVINVIFTLTVSNISIPGHLGGLATGFLAAIAIAYAPRDKRNLVQGLGLGAIFLVLVVLAVVRTMSLP
ncbi:rhomboid family intramembrane serine protease [Winogradskya consettensis]|uniref:Rhomboid family intramembrane serine protease n=1 Tax=Winogradskya consettensis TaxID=113560 RepID=A0A919W6F3_9ACTN|nr:rhomboid family intramembrane serine protease [Actinoplanes consettensis]GIM83252.1 rhomboid family intramembrane serine protease [Actinoplanes consettensis]